jgi:glutathione S-transferase
VIRQWDILEARLALPNQEYIALKDRPTLADLSYFPFAMPWIFRFLGVDIEKWPAIKQWGEKMLKREAVQIIMQKAPSFGH